MGQFYSSTLNVKMVEFLIASALAALAIADGTDNGISATCKEDNTIDVTINYDQASKIIGATYGSCNETDIDGAVTTNDVTSWAITLNPSRCGMESKLRNLVYNQTASFRFGRKDGNTEIVFATMEVDSYCNYTSEYTVTFAYGPVNADNSNYNTLFDTNGSAKCTNSLIDLSVSYVGGSGQHWKISHVLFLLNDEKESSYTLSCSVLVCDMQQASACSTAKTCLGA